MELPDLLAQALHDYRDTASLLSQWAPTVHRLVRDRITALAEADGREDTGTETAEQFAARVHAHGQNPFPEGTCIYDDTGYDANVNIGYDHISVGYGHGDDGPLRVTYTGRYPVWSADGESYVMRTAEIHCPGWLVTDPDGVDRYRRQTQRMAADVRAERADEVHDLLDWIHERRTS